MSFVNQKTISSIVKPGSTIVGQPVADINVHKITAIAASTYSTVLELGEKAFHITKNFFKR